MTYNHDQFNDVNRPDHNPNRHYASAGQGAGKMGTFIALAAILGFFGLILFYAGGTSDTSGPVTTGSTQTENTPSTNIQPTDDGSALKAKPEGNSTIVVD